MITNLPPRVVRSRGITLLELTVTISVLIVFITIVFIGTRAWKRGGDRAACILAQRNVQMATRAYQNIYGYNYGGRPYAEAGTQDIARHLFEKGYIEKDIYDQASGETPCPGGGSYTCPLPDIFPQSGELYMKCSLSTTEAHEPSTHADW
jgi:type II secretory pathway pseudopilin PulG